MRIKELQKTTPALSSGPVVENKRGANEPNMGFQRRMSNLSQAAYEEHIQHLAQRITQQGTIVASKMNLSELQKYRELITELLGETASNAFTYSRRDRLDTRGRYKVITVVKKINQRLDELTGEILSAQADNIRVLSLVDEVRGLLVDLLL